MRSGERALVAVVGVVLVGALVLAYLASGTGARAVERPRSAPGVRLSMRALHDQGGVPLGWQPRLAPGDRDSGRAAFVDLGCPSCHRVAGERFVPTGAGPDLSGMGSHHPAAYFAEALLDPDAVLIDEPGYIGEDGRSIMPSYPDMTVGQLSDLVAYLTSLTEETRAASCHDGGATSVGPLVRDDAAARAAPPADAGRAFFAQSYDVAPERLGAFEEWFATAGRSQLRAIDGLVAVDTFVDAARPGAPYTTVLGFRDEAALRTFLADPASSAMWRGFDGFVGTHGHHATELPLVYRAPSLSLGAAALPADAAS